MSKNLGTFLITVALVVAVILIGTLVPDVGVSGANLRWGLMALAMVAFLVGIGFEVNGRAAGVLIDDRFKMSLSRLQLTAWTVLALSAFLTIAIPRSVSPRLDALPTDEQVAACIARLEESDAEGAAEIARLWEGATEEGALEAATPAQQAQWEQAREMVREACPAEPLNVQLPTELLVAMGISVGSFVSAGLVKSTKTSKKVDVELLSEKEQRLEREKQDAETALAEATDTLTEAARELSELETIKAGLQAQLVALGAPPAPPSAGAPTETEIREQLAQAEAEMKRLQEKKSQAFAAQEAAKEASERAAKALDDFRAVIQQSQGSLHRNSKASEAAWADIFRGEEIGNYWLIDLGKVQMFFLTVAVIFAYGAAVYGLLAKGALYDPLGVALPAFADSLNALLAISHAGYLTDKAVDQTKIEK